VKRHGVIRKFGAAWILRGCSDQPITERINRSLLEFAANLPFFRQRRALMVRGSREIRADIRLYGVKLLTMIKNVLIAAISFPALNQ
jgi:hypothetical protein